MAASALTTATASALQSTLHELPKSSQQSPRHQLSTTVAVNSASIEVSKALQEGEKFIKWEEVSFQFF
jgi:N12 class adenine-specific DNA methylase